MEVLVVDYEAAKKCDAIIPHSLHQSLPALLKIVDEIKNNTANYTGDKYLEYADTAYKCFKNTTSRLT